MHTIAVLLQNMHHLLSSLREPQAADALGALLESDTAAKHAAAEALRESARAARELAATVAQNRAAAASAATAPLP